MASAPLDDRHWQDGPVPDLAFFLFFFAVNSPPLSPEGGTSVPSCVSRRTTAILKHRDAEGTELLRLPPLCLPSLCLPSLCLPTLCLPTLCLPTLCLPTLRRPSLRRPSLRVLCASVFPILLFRSNPRHHRQPTVNASSGPLSPRLVASPRQGAESGTLWHFTQPVSGLKNKRRPLPQLAP